MNTEQPRPYHLPVACSATAVIALGLLAAVGDGMVRPMVVVIAVVFLAHYLVPLRLPRSSNIEWVVRLIALSAIGLIARASSDVYSDVGNPMSIVVIGCVAAGEMALQVYRAKPAVLSTILCVGIIYLSGCFQNTIPIIPQLSPVFFLALIISWRSIDIKHDSVRLTALTLGLYAISIALSLTIGFTATSIVSSNKELLNTYAQKLLENPDLPSDAGMSDEPRLGSVDGLEGSTERVLKIKGALLDPHLRAAAFHDYSSGAWSPRLTGREFTPLGPSLGSANVKSPIVTVTKLRYSGGVIYFPLDSQFLGLNRQDRQEWCQQYGGPILTKTLEPSVYTFVQSQSGSEFLDQPLQKSMFARDLFVPREVDRRVITLSQQVTKYCETDQDKVAAICANLDANHGYSLNYQAGLGDPVSDFILGKASAHCEYFASAAVIMLRCVHIPARYVIGYYAHETDSLGETVVRQRDAHAWAEAYIDGAWTTVDATPGGGRPDKFFGQPPALQLMIEALEDRIQLLQQTAAEIGPAKIIGWVVAVAIGYLLLRLVIAELIEKRWRRARSSRATGLLDNYTKRFNRLLKKRGIVIPEELTWGEYFEVEVNAPLPHNEVIEFIIRYNSVRFGLKENSDILDGLLNVLEIDAGVKEKV